MCDPTGAWENTNLHHVLTCLQRRTCRLPCIYWACQAWAQQWHWPTSWQLMYPRVPLLLTWQSRASPPPFYQLLTLQRPVVLWARQRASHIAHRHSSHHRKIFDKGDEAVT